MNSDRSVAQNRTTRATSSGSPIRPSGTPTVRAWSLSDGVCPGGGGLDAGRADPRGRHRETRMPCSANSSASCCVRPRSRTSRRRSAGCPSGAAHARPRRQVHDHPAPTGVDHAARRFPAADERSPQVDVEHTLPVVVGQLEDGRRGIDARVVHPDVDPAELGDGRVGGVGDRRGVGDVEPGRDRGAAVGRGEVVGSRGQRRRGRGRRSTPTRRPPRGGARSPDPRPTRPAGDDGVLSRQGDQLAEGLGAQIGDGHVRCIAQAALGPAGLQPASTDVV